MKPDKILNYFSLLKQKGSIGQSYLFIGDNFAVVESIAKLINCEGPRCFCGTCYNCTHIAAGTHPDLCVVEPKRLTITIEDIRNCQQFLRLTSFRAPYKVVIVRGAQHFGEEAANAFLKTLEEPPKHSFIAICTSKLDGMLPTIISRCRKIFLPCDSAATQLQVSALIPQFLKGEKPAFKDRNDFAAFIWTFVVFFRDYLVNDAIGGVNNRLLKIQDYEIILTLLKGRKKYSAVEAQAFIAEMLKIYGAHSSVNENLALQLIKMRLQ
ncbi:MAG: hypothetical protein WCI77_00395 [Candidatus Omnitrophota bacterium]